MRLSQYNAIYPLTYYCTIIDKLLFQHCEGGRKVNRASCDRSLDRKTHNGPRNAGWSIVPYSHFPVCIIDR